MRVIMFPGKGNENENRYIDILVDSLCAAGVDVEGWDKHLSWQRGDVFHVHWPEVIGDIRGRKWQRLRGDWIQHQFFRTIDRIRARGGALVWTVHDIEPHNKSLGDAPFHRHLIARFAPKVDYLLSLTSAGIGDIQRRIPSLAGVPCAVARHPHYRGVLGSGRLDADARAAAGIQAGQRVFALLGTLRANKRPELVLRAFREIPRDQAFLIMAGSASAHVAHDLHLKAADMTNARLELRRIAEREMIDLYAIADILVFPGVGYFNSGTIYTSLSLGVPVIAAWSEVNAEIQEIVGTRWLHLYEGELTGRTLEAAAAVLVQRRQDEQCDLTPFSPDQCARQHVQAYESAIALRRSIANYR
jgi:beta-1,4-mannosyltransferase